MKQKTLIIGLTGAVGAGKSTVARQFARLGCAVIDADELGHEVLTLPEVIQELLRWWGPQVLGPDGAISREAVGRIVFQDSGERKKLTTLVHPLIAEREKQLLAGYEGDSAVEAVVLDVPLLYEAGQDEWCDVVVFVSAEADVRTRRLVENRGWEAEKIKKIENCQMAMDMKARMADHVIENNSSIPALSEQVANLFSLLKNTQF